MYEDYAVSVLSGTGVHIQNVSKENKLFSSFEGLQCFKLCFTMTDFYPDLQKKLKIN